MESYAAGETSPPLLEETIGANLQRIAAEHGDREALVEVATGRRWTYRELDAEVDVLARGLLATGIQKGDRVGIWAPNCAEWLLVQYATAKVGAILVNVNPAYRSHELEYVLRQSGMRLLFSASAFKSSDYAAMIEEVSGGVETLERTVFVDRDEWEEFASATVDREAIAARMASQSFDDPINVQYTSGTTGFPKGATLSHHNILNNGFFVCRLLGYTEADRVCLPVPFYHCFGMVMGTLGAVSHGSCVVIPAPSFEPAATLSAVAEEAVTSLYGVPTMFIAMLEHPDFASFELSSLRTGIM